ncbi:hypothetical protein INR49_032676 [Caranx melampygus]|nr:hypothetical protein INR49_032676 [Caranx melampygus]
METWVNEEGRRVARWLYLVFFSTFEDDGAIVPQNSPKLQCGHLLLSVIHFVISATAAEHICTDIIFILAVKGHLLVDKKRERSRCCRQIRNVICWRKEFILLWNES